MPRKPPGAKAKGLGAELRRLRERGNISLPDAAAPVGLSKWSLSRLELGQRNIAPDEVAGLLAVYGVVGAERERLLTMARTMDVPGWWEVGLPGLTKESVTLADYEAVANEIVDWAPLLIPGLLQTMPFAKAFMEVYGLPVDLIESRATARLRRQQTLYRPDVKYTAYVGESALRVTVGNPKTMLDQLRALQAAGLRDNVTLRVVPSRSAAHPGLLGAFLLLRFPTAPEVVHAEMAASGVFHDEPGLTSPYVEAVRQLSDVALDATESERLIAEAATELE